MRVRPERRSRARLSEDPKRTVLLIEAGSWFRGADALPEELRYGGVLSAMMPGHTANWSLTATLGEGMLQPLPRGKVVGGSSALNGALFTRGLPEDFDGWAAEGNSEWSYDKVLPFFRKLENDHDIRDQYHGALGPVPIRRAAPGELVQIDHAFLAACREAGFPDDPDMNGPDSIGAGLIPTNNADGVRMNTGLTYVDLASERSNLTVQPNATVLRVLLEERQAIGVEVLIEGEVTRIYAGEVVLSAGAVESPHLLMLSGVGPGEELARHGIAVRHELPQVGRQFTDHGSLTLPFSMAKRRSRRPDPRCSTWAHAGLHFTTDASDEVSDMALLQSAIPVNYSVFHGMGPLARLGVLQEHARRHFARQAARPCPLWLEPRVDRDHAARRQPGRDPSGVRRSPCRAGTALSLPRKRPRPRPHARGAAHRSAADRQCSLSRAGSQARRDLRCRTRTTTICSTAMSRRTSARRSTWPHPAAWAPRPITRSSTSIAGCMASRACAWSIPRSCRAWCGAALPPRR